MKNRIGLFAVIILAFVAFTACDELGGVSKPGDNTNSIAYYLFAEMVDFGSGDFGIVNKLDGGDELNAIADGDATVAEGGMVFDTDTDADNVLDTAHTGVLDGTDDYFTIEDLKSGFIGDFTVTAWVKPDISGNMTIVSKHTASGSSDELAEFFFGIVGGNLTLILGNGTGVTTVAGASTISTANFTFVAATVSGTDIAIYINPEDGIDEDNEPDSEATGVFSDGIRQDGTESVLIGYYDNGSDYFFDGNIDQVRLYGSALTAGEIRGVYLSEDGI